MSMLTNDCLWLIFDFLDPINWVSVSQVCKNWEQLVETKLEKITEILVKNPQSCTKRVIKRLKTIPIDKNELYSALQKIGPYVQSVKIVDGDYDKIILGHKYAYQIQNIKDPKELISILAQTCANIEVLQVGKNCIDLEELLQSNSNLKKLILPTENLNRFFTFSLDSVEEVIWEVTITDIYDFYWFFPNVKKLTLIINASFFDAEHILYTILGFTKDLKFLSVFINTFIQLTYRLTMLSDISTLSQLEELRISMGRYRKAVSIELDFKKESVIKLIENCQNLQIVKFDTICLGSADVESFFALPKLKELAVTSKFSEFKNRSFSKKIEHLTSLEIHFEPEDEYSPPCLCEAVKMMPALTYLKIDGMDDDETTDLTLIAIKSALSRDKNVFIKPMGNNICKKVYKIVKSESKSKPLKLWIEPQRSYYFDEINKLVKLYKHCLFVDDEFETFEQDDLPLFKQYVDTYKCCLENKPFVENDYHDSDESEVGSGSESEREFDPESSFLGEVSICKMS